MKDHCKILNEIIKAYYDNEYPEYFQDDVYKIFKKENITKEYKAEPIVRCKNCKFYKQLDSVCPYLGEYGYYNEFPDENDFCSRGERKTR